MTTSIPASYASPIVIRSSRLAVEIAAPGTVYNRTRFDWSGFVTQVTLDGSHTFCVPEDYDPNAGTGGIGLCNEFGIEKHIGYADARPGESFPKLGIGLLTRPNDAPYNFFKPHEIAQRFPIHIETGENQARFTVDPIDCQGFAARETKTLSVADNCLQIAYRLENVGRRPLITHEYCHNFVGIDQQPLSEDYRLHFPYPVKFEEIPGLDSMISNVLRVDGQDIRWKWTPQKAFYCRPIGFYQTSQPQWELKLEKSGVGMREYDDFAPARVALWGTTHVVSAEIFIDINLHPGQSQTWTRRYEFFD
jgi:hypothetical protein